MRIARFAAAALTVAALAAPVLPAHAVTVPAPSIVHVDTIANPDFAQGDAPVLDYLVAAGKPFLLSNLRTPNAPFDKITYTLVRADVGHVGDFVDSVVSSVTEPGLFASIPPAPNTSTPTYYLRRSTTPGVNIASLTVIG